MSHITVAFVSDFFYPNIGGVENHIYEVSKHMIKQGVKVILITHHYGKKRGIRYLDTGLKVYYVPRMLLWRQSTLPSFMSPAILYRDIFIKEQVTIVHGQTSFSCMSCECNYVANQMGLPLFYTEHSVTKPNEIYSYIINDLCKWSYSEIEQIVCVSEASKRNVIERIGMEEEHLTVIGNAVNGKMFYPRTPSEQAIFLENKRMKDKNGKDTGREWITICIFSRLMKKKGTDLMVEIIPTVCAKYDNVRFVVGGDGERMIDLIQMMEQNNLEDRIQLLGNTAHDDARNVMIQCDIFLNCSLSESFCIVVLEAACSGLYVVSTNVDAIPDILPHHMASFGDPTPESMTAALCTTVDMFHRGKQPDTTKFHAELTSIYDWGKIAAQTIALYRDALDRKKQGKSLFPDRWSHIKRLFRMGILSGTFLTAHYLFFTAAFKVIQKAYPEEDIELAPALLSDQINNWELLENDED
ncbi:putative Phosphatidylinositol N-acetylglucosaminyltransferase subunit A [Blattamonas nauphoetae]|uniref:Phosphatidylinositol N-acetylglucosaminyltransferase subunit A n=1 Tax=Blattamonas nauphoetae TaxID=2049346 RepID=A0ABQ9YKJ7_9EUKA|nr:putative Phosphatidylinositol N-acetylglucosaminyltransferase subunit A [Blattamonas nauphoetae]